MKRIIPFILIVALYSCSNNKEYKVRVINSNNNNLVVADLEDENNGNFLKVSQVVDSVIMLKLNNIENDSYIDWLNFIIGKQYIYIYENSGSIAIFNLKGNFVKRINNGNGPGELVNATSCEYDKYTDQLLVCQVNGINIYDAVGNYIKSVNVPFIPHEMKAFADGYIYYNLSVWNSGVSFSKDYAIAITDKNFNIKSVAVHDINYRNYLTSHKRFNVLNDSIISFGIPFNDTIYQYSNDTVRPILVLNYPNYKLDVSEANDHDSFIELAKKTGKAFFDGDYSETYNYQYVCLSSIGGCATIIIDKRTGILYHYPLIDDNHDLPNDMTLCPVGALEDYFIFCLEPYKYDKKLKSSRYLTQEQIDFLNNLDDEDNPVLFLIKFK